MGNLQNLIFGGFEGNKEGKLVDYRVTLGLKQTDADFVKWAVLKVGPRASKLRKD